MAVYSVLLLLLLVGVIAVIVLFAARRVRREQAQEGATEPAKESALRTHQPPAVKIKMVEGGGLWEPWASVPPPRAEPKRAQPEPPPNAKGTPPDRKDR